MCFNPSPVRRVPSPNRYIAVAKFCFCKNNKRLIDRLRAKGASCAEQRTGEATYARGRKCENALELRGKRVPAEFPGQAIARERTLAQGDGFMGALGCTQRTRGSRRVGSALEWQGGATCTVEETCARDSAQAAGVCSQHAWCGGEGDCASKRAGSSAEEARICVEERAFRAR